MCNILDYVGQQLREAREAKGLSLRQLADNSGVSLSRIWETEKGSRAAKIDTIARIADALDMKTLRLKR